MKRLLEKKMNAFTRSIVETAADKKDKTGFFVVRSGPTQYAVAQVGQKIRSYPTGRIIDGLPEKIQVRGGLTFVRVSKRMHSSQKRRLHSNANS